MSELSYRAVERLLTHLENRGLMEGLQLSDEDIADTIWLALQMGVVETKAEPKQPNEKQSNEVIVEDGEITQAESTPENDSSVNVYSQESITQDSKTEESQSQETHKSLPFQAPAAPALQNKLPIGRALRPLMRKVDSVIKTAFDVEATVNRIVEQDIWLPVTKPEPERWLNLELVIEESRSSFIWQETIDELQKLLQNQGAFRTVRVWSLSNKGSNLQLTRRRKGSKKNPYQHSYRELIHSNGRGLILLVSDCVSDIWQQWEIYQWLQKLSNKVPTAIMQLFPERLWQSSGLGLGYKLQLSAFNPGVSNSNLELPSLWEELKQEKILKLPVVTPEAFSLGDWAKVVAGHGNISTPGFVFELEFLEEQTKQQIKQQTNQEPDQKQDKQSPTDKPQEELSQEAEQEAENLVDRFLATASPIAQELSGYMAAVPVDLKVVNLIRKTLLPKSTPVNVAEVFLSGMIQRVDDSNNNQNPQYDFIPGARKLLNQATRLKQTENVLDVLSEYIAKELKFPSSIKTFRAFFEKFQDFKQEEQQQILPFAKLTIEVLGNLGSEYVGLAEEVKRNTEVSSQNEPTPEREDPQIPPLKTCNFKVAIIDEILETRTFEFDVVTLEQKRLFFGLGNRWVDNRQQKRATSIIEVIQPGVELELIEIPGGTFKMGAPETEQGSRESERPQHQVTVPSFFMGKYQVTQAQWKAVANLPQVETKLKPEPSEFKGDNLPVEQVSWYSAVEFCARLSKHTGREYRLPSEAEWEYACRAGTTTPFHFGETITTDLANYNGLSTYRNGPKGKNRGETTPVGSFKVANGFGLYDMHGNLWEWCLDDWHSNYEGAPTDGSAWLDENDNLSRRTGRAVLRGGSWSFNPDFCRSACRFSPFAERHSVVNIGFRVVCGFGRG